MAQSRQQQGQMGIAAGFYLQAAQAFATAQDYQQAGQAFAAIEGTGTDLTQTQNAVGFYRVAAILDLHHRRFEDAALALAQIVPSRDTNRDATARVRSALCAEQRNWACAASALITLANPADHAQILVLPEPEPVVETPSSIPAAEPVAGRQPVTSEPTTDTIDTGQPNQLLSSRHSNLALNGPSIQQRLASSSSTTT